MSTRPKIENDPRRCGVKPAPRKCFDPHAFAAKVRRHRVTASAS